MSDAGRIREQRDRFLAFSFAASDLLLEIDAGGAVVWALGAARGVTGADESALIGRGWLGLFAEEDRAVLGGLFARAEPVRRCGPLLVTLDESLGGKGRKAVISAIRMPGSDRFYVTLGFTSVLTARIGEALGAGQEALQGTDSFLRAAKDAMVLARTLGQEIALTLLDIEGVEEMRARLGTDAARELEDAIGRFLAGKSLDGQSAGILAEGRFGLVHDAELPASSFGAQISKLAGKEGASLTVRTRTLSGALEQMDERGIGKALLYALGEFERRGAKSPIRGLDTSFRDYLGANTEKVGQFRSFVEQLKFEIFFQPVVDLKTLEAHHFEILSRFPSAEPTAEWVAFGEDVGLSTDFDAAVCERVINYLLYKSAGRRTRFAINLSPASLRNDKFLGDLLSRIKKTPDLAGRMIFELSGFPEALQNEKVEGFIRTVREAGVEVGFDDFPVVSGMAPELQSLPVNYVKLDGGRIRRMLASSREAGQMRDAVARCHDLGIVPIAEIVETDDQAWRLRHMGFTLAQGFLFAPPRPKPDYAPPEKALAQIAGHA